MSLRVHALAYAAQGWPVFPVRRDKVPIIKGWHHRASTDPIQVWTWWATFPQANIGCATGHVFDVLDLDSVDARAAYEQIVAEAGHAFTGPIARSGRQGGGWHLFYAPTGQGNRGTKTLDHVDFRGRGGFVILPPSIHETGGVYTWLRAPEPGQELPQLPTQVRHRLWPPQTQPATPMAVPGEVEDARLAVWAEAALAAILGELKEVPAGKGLRNRELNRLGFRAFQLAHVLGDGYVAARLYEAAEAIGYVNDKGAKRAHSTIRSAMAGLRQPRYPSTGGTR